MEVARKSRRKAAGRYPKLNHGATKQQSGYRNPSGLLWLCVWFNLVRAVLLPGCSVVQIADWVHSRALAVNRDDSIATMRMLMSAGLTPLTRLAWPRVTGRSEASLRALSRRRPRI